MSNGGYMGIALIALDIVEKKQERKKHLLIQG